MSRVVADLLSGLFVVAIIYVLVRPQSKGVQFVQAFGQALTAIVKNAADLGASEE